MSSLAPLNREEILKVRDGMVKAMVRGEKPGIQMLELKINLKEAFRTKTLVGMDMGGSNFRASLIKLEIKRANSECKRSFEIISSKKWKIPHEVKNSLIFEWTAARIKEFVLENRLDSKFTAGFTFSFPVTQNAINEGFLVQWNKSFEAEEFIGKDIARVLEEECQKIGLQLKVGTVLNDVISTYLTGLFLCNECRIAVVLGTGTNAALLIKREHDLVTLVNTEWGAYGEHPLDYLPQTAIDQQLDIICESGNQHFEKMTSGMYLPRLYQLMGDDAHVMTTQELSEGDELDPKIKYLSNRSVDLITAGILAAVEFLKIKGDTVILVDGSLYEKYHNYAERLQNRINELTGSQKISLVLAKDFSSVGSIIPL
jgi:hexokinase